MADRPIVRAAPVVIALALVASPAFAERTTLSGVVNEANDPLTPKLNLMLEDQYIGSYKDLSPDSNANGVFLRAVIPYRLGLPQILRVALPLLTTPDQPLPATTGLGDLTIVDLLLFKWYSQEFGIGPMLTFPTATEDLTGSGKWLAGAAAGSIETEEWGLFGALVSYQHSFAGDSARPRVSVLEAQPFITVNLPAGFYLRSTATWIFDTERQVHVIPVGIGAGKVWLLGGGTTLNSFVEPQFTVAREGITASWQIHAGVNAQFPIGLR